MRQATASVPRFQATAGPGPTRKVQGPARPSCALATARPRARRHRRGGRSSASPRTVTAGASQRSGTDPQPPGPLPDRVRRHDVVCPGPGAGKGLALDGGEVGRSAPRRRSHLEPMLAMPAHVSSAVATLAASEARPVCRRRGSKRLIALVAITSLHTRTPHCCRRSRARPLWPLRASFSVTAEEHSSGPAEAAIRRHTRPGLIDEAVGASE